MPAYYPGINADALETIGRTGKDLRGRRVALRARFAARQIVENNRKNPSAQNEATINQNSDGTLSTPVASVEPTFSPVPPSYTPNSQPVATSVVQPSTGGAIGYANVGPRFSKEKTENNKNEVANKETTPKNSGVLQNSASGTFERQSRVQAVIETNTPFKRNGNFIQQLGFEAFNMVPSTLNQLRGGVESGIYLLSESFKGSERRAAIKAGLSFYGIQAVKESRFAVPESFSTITREGKFNPAGTINILTLGFAKGRVNEGLRIEDVNFKAGLEEFRVSRGALGEIVEKRFSAPQGNPVEPIELPSVGAVQKFRLSTDSFGREVLRGDIIQTGSVKGTLRGKPFEAPVEVKTSFSGVTETPGEFVVAGKQTQTFDIPQVNGGTKQIVLSDQLSGAFDFNEGYGLFLKDEGSARAILGKETGSYFEITNVNELARVSRGKRFVELDTPYSILTKKSRIKTGEVFSSDSVTVREGVVTDYGKSLTQLRSTFNKMQRAEVIPSDKGFSYGPVSKRTLTRSEGVANEFEGGVILKPSFAVEKGRALGLRTGILQRPPVVVESQGFEFGLKIKAFDNNFLKVLQKEPLVNTFKGETLFTGKPDFSLLSRNVARVDLESVRVTAPPALSDLRTQFNSGQQSSTPFLLGFYDGPKDLAVSQGPSQEFRASQSVSLKRNILLGVSNSDLKQNTGSVLRQNSRSLLRQNPRSDLRQNPRSDTRIESKLDNRLDSRLDSRLSTRQDTRLDTRLATRLQTRLKVRLNLNITSRTNLPKIPALRSKDDDALYRVVVGRKGRKYTYDLGTGDLKLVLKGKGLVQNTAARTLTVKRIGGGANANLASALGKDFYGNSKGQFVQKVKNSINSSGEKSQIPGASLRVQNGLNKKRFRY